MERLIGKGVTVSPLILFVLATAPLTRPTFHEDGIWWWITQMVFPFSDEGRQAARDAVTPDSGLQVLPPETLEMVTLVRRNRVLHYSVSTRIRTDRLLWQMLVEPTFPRTYRPDAKYRLAFVDEPQRPGCQAMDQLTQIELYDCH